MTTQVQVSALTKRFGRNTVVDDLHLQIEQGEFLVLLGPSGCGKTTTLRCLGGLETPSSGTISFRDRPVFDADRKVDIAPNHRNIGMVFQSYALWPHMTVRQNIRYPLKVRRMKKAMAEGAVESMADMVHCGELLDRLPSQLSGGQQQRVALARGLVHRPELVLFDEPLSNLDARLRDLVRTEIHQLHQRLGFTAVFVTHDQSEALALGDRLAIMNQGRIEQMGTPWEVFQAPVSEYVAAFIGMANRLPLVRSHVGWQTTTGEPVDIGSARIGGDQAVARLRPDDIAVHRDSTTVPAGHVRLPATLVTAEYGGRHYDVTVEYAGHTLYLKSSIGADGTWVGDLAPGTNVTVSFAPSNARYYSDGSTAVTTSADAVTVGVGVGVGE
ncbi:ABC transporter ATP-binding protein [Allosalinactinospora lopnorensis]|uniref:ABC transporter ATP-binding protein n=1 Tax=Allosalinactinospora lopnorensis TaxID=1352348 RepID=UPI000623F31E|nr:ABC transporter ATP-binding protein [Allosalinactinospora lopnorensis]